MSRIVLSHACSVRAARPIKPSNDSCKASNSCTVSNLLCYCSTLVAHLCVIPILPAAAGIHQESMPCGCWVCSGGAAPERGLRERCSCIQRGIPDEPRAVPGLRGTGSGAGAGLQTPVPVRLPATCLHFLLDLHQTHRNINEHYSEQ